MSEQQLETATIVSIICIAFPVCVFLIAVILTLREKRIRQTKINAIQDDILNADKRKNGKH